MLPDRLPRMLQAAGQRHHIFPSAAVIIRPGHGTPRPDEHERHVKMHPFYYEGFGGSKSFCGLEVLSTGIDAATVILTELPGNPGTPVREFFEHLATLLYRNRIRFLQIAPGQIVWIEHHPETKGDYATGTGESYEQVVMQWDGERFHSPARLPIPRGDWSRYHPR